MLLAYVQILMLVQSKWKVTQGPTLLVEYCRSPFQVEHSEHSDKHQRGQIALLDLIE